MIRMIGRQEYVLAQRIRAVMDDIRPPSAQSRFAFGLERNQAEMAT